MQSSSQDLPAVVPTQESQEQILLTSLSQGDRSAFWQLWVRYQDYLYSRCLTWMAGNHMDASEALSRAMLKAWDKLPDYAGKITNLKAWLTRLTHNLCVDMHRERNRGARGIESIEEIAVGEDETVASTFESPDSAVLRHELGAIVRREIDALPPRLREPFILRCCQEMSYQDVAQRLTLSNDNVRKRIQQAREILQKQLNQYFSGLDGSVLEEPEPEEPATFNWETSMTVQCIAEQINYQVTALCIKTLPHTWYSSPSLLAWR
ncbi:MAG: RNA polymerase sigma factor [Aphanothece sp. CMT-3BRIN-NPC111]|jgi:RNA polymerase sigma-70 factor (ECF subfamily)|nr:RNA polymerase sigma factor [Aphanothece sp. CMT-3BRIN-NPC111]